MLPWDGGRDVRGQHPLHPDKVKAFPCRNVAVRSWLTPWPSTTAPLCSSVGSWGRRWFLPLPAAL